MILVTGGAGFIGSNFILDWLGQGAGPVANVDKLTYAGNIETLSSIADRDDYLFFRADIGDRAEMDRILAECKPKAVVNFAAESHVDRSIHGPSDFINTNIVGTFSLLESVRNYWQTLSGEMATAFRFVHVSTDEVYGSLEKEEAPFSEMNQYKPNSPYSASKAASDHLVRAWHHTYGLPILTTNCSNNYGPYQFPEKLIPLIIHNALQGKSLPVYGDGQQIRDWLYVGDHCSAIRHVLEHGVIGEVYNVGGGNEKANLDVVTEICDLLDKIQPRNDGASYRDLITFVTDRPGHDRRYAINSDKIQGLGWSPAESFDSGIEKTVRWYLDNGRWVENVVSGQYREWVTKQYGRESQS